MYNLAIAFVAGAISALGFAPVGWWPLTLLAFAVLLWLIEIAPSLRSALARGWWFGVGQFVLGLNWIATAFTYQEAMPAWLGWVAVLLLSFYLAVFPAVAAGLAWRWGRGNSLSLTILLAAAWIVTEWLRGGLFTGFPWNPLGVSLVDTPLAGLATVFGTYGLGAIVILLAGLIKIACVGPKRRSALALGAVAVLCQIVAWIVAGPSEVAMSLNRPALRLVQPNISQAQKHGPEGDQLAADRLTQLSPPFDQEPRLLFWPEGAVPVFLEEEPETRRQIGNLLGPRGLLLTGGVKMEQGTDNRTAAERNSVFAMDARGRILGRYDKAHLVPYGEYLPLRSILSAIGVQRLVPGNGQFLEGPGPRTLSLPGFGRAGIQICYEIIFSGHVIDRANRPDFIFNPSNDAWFGTWGPPQHLAQARLRAIEEALPVIRATPTGISAVIDARGNILAALPLNAMGAIDTRLPQALPPTLFARFGNLLPFAFALLLAAAAIAVRRKSR